MGCKSRRVASCKRVAADQEEGGRFENEVFGRSLVLRLADSGHANGAPEKNEPLRCRSVGSYFLSQSPAQRPWMELRLAATPWEAVEAGDWILEEALAHDVGLKSWSQVISDREASASLHRGWQDYLQQLQQDANSTSTDR